MKRLLLAVSLLAVAALPSHADELTGTLKTIQQSKTIRLGYLKDGVPFSFADDKQEAAGFTVDLCRRVASSIQQQLGLDALQVKWVPVTQENRFDMVRNGSIDLECGTTTNTLSRQRMVDFSVTTWVDGGSFVVDPAVSSARTLSDLAGKRVAVIADTTTDRALREISQRNGLALQLVTVKDHVEGLNALKDAKADAYASDQAVLIGLAFAVRNQFRILISEQPFSFEPYALVLRRGDPDFRLAVNTALARVLRTGQVVEIYNRWFSRLGKPSPLVAATWATNGLPE